MNYPVAHRQFQSSTPLAPTPTMKRDYSRASIAIRIQVHVCMFELMFRVDRMLTLVSLAQLCHPKSLLFSCSELSTLLPGRLLAMVYIP